MTFKPARHLKFSAFSLLLLILQFTLSSSLLAQQNSVDDNDIIKIGYVFSDGNMVGTLAAFRDLLIENPELEGKVEFNFLTESFFDSVDPRQLNNSDVLVMDMMNQQILERYNETHEVDLIESVSTNGEVLAVGIGIQPLEYYTDQGAIFDETAMAYWQNGGQVNQLSLIQTQLLQLIGDAHKPTDSEYYLPGFFGVRYCPKIQLPQLTLSIHQRVLCLLGMIQNLYAGYNQFDLV